MQSVTINIKNKETRKKIILFLEQLQDDGVEIVSLEDHEDLKLLTATRCEESISYDEYLKNADKD